MELQVGNNVMTLFSLSYIAAFHTVHAHYFSCVLLFVIYGGWGGGAGGGWGVTTLSLIFFSIK